jgi:hypothetical protein
MPTDTDDFDDFDDFDNEDLDDEDLDDEDLDDEDDDQREPGLPWPPPPGAYPPPPGGVNRGARRAGLLAVTAVVAGVAGFGVVAAALHGGTAGGSPGAAAGSPSPGASSGSPGGGPRTQLPPQAGGGGALPAPGSGQQELIEIDGKVEAVSSTSITVGGPGQSVTAAVTAATKVTGRVSRIGSVKVGDYVAVSITGTDGKLTADSIQDPASMS